MGKLFEFLVSFFSKYSVYLLGIAGIVLAIVFFAYLIYLWVIAIKCRIERKKDLKRKFGKER